MHRSVFTAVLAAVFVYFLLAPATAEIRNLKISADARPMILFEKFGFTSHTGHLTVAVSAVSVTSRLANMEPYRLGFFLLSEEYLIQALIELQQNPNLCLLDSKYINHLFTFRKLFPPPHSSFNQSYPVTAPNEYSLFFANCAPGSQVTMDVHTEVYNLERR